MQLARIHRYRGEGENGPAGKFTEAEARLLCYVLGPLSAVLMLKSRRYGHEWTIRFHALHSMLVATAWAIAWGGLRFIEAISPWFLGTLVEELRLITNLGFLVAWVCLMIAAYQGERCAVVPYLHRLAIRLARRSEKHGDAHPASA